MQSVGIYVPLERSKFNIKHFNKTHRESDNNNDDNSVNGISYLNHEE